MLSEEKKQKKLINANVITRHNAIVISCDDISIDQFLLLFSSLSMRLLDFFCFRISSILEIH